MRGCQITIGLYFKTGFNKILTRLLVTVTLHILIDQQKVTETRVTDYKQVVG